MTQQTGVLQEAEQVRASGLMPTTWQMIARPALANSKIATVELLLSIGSGKTVQLPRVPTGGNQGQSVPTPTTKLTPQEKTTINNIRKGLGLDPIK